MGSIFGLFQRDGSGAGTIEINAMSKALQHRVSDRSWHWSRGAFALGAHLLHRTPEAELEKPPEPQTAERYVISCDARIDNIAEIVSEFGLDHGIKCDSEIILELYKLCGKKCVDHLLGGFAFAIVDQVNNEIFCARDHFGEKPFTYFMSGKIFAFASEPRAIADAGISSGKVNDARIADFLLASINDKTTTIHDGIYRLPPAHCMTITARDFKIEPYWELAVPKELNSASDEKIAGRFRELLEQAVDCRLRSNAPIGSLLSGGIDSSAITMLARKGLAERRPGQAIAGFSAIFPDVPACDERKWVELVQQEQGDNLAPLETHQLRADVIGPVDFAAMLVQCADEPIIAPNQFMVWSLLDIARESGVGIILTGHDGDTVVSHGFAWLTELTFAENWDSLELELGRMGDLLEGYGNARRSLLQNYALPCLTVLRQRVALFQLCRTIFVLHNRFSVPGRELLAAALPPWIVSLRRRLKKQTGARTLPEIGSDFQASDVFRQRQQIRAAPFCTDAQDEHLRGLNSPLITETFEMFDRMGAHFGLEMRHPFFDKRLVEFCLSLPREQKIRDGWTRYVLREAMTGILPEPIRLRRDKSNLGHNFARSLLKDINTVKQTFHTIRYNFDRYWNCQILNEIADRYSAKANGVDAQTLHLAYTHALWLNARQSKLTVQDEA